MQTHSADLMAHRILIVDDEPALARTLAVIFERAGYAATAVTSCEAALPVIAEQQPLFVVSDVVLPGMNGIALAIQVRSLYPDCGILLFSGNADTTDLLDSARARGFEFEVLAKPVSPAKILALVSEMIQAKGIPKQHVP